MNDSTPENVAVADNQSVDKDTMEIYAEFVGEELRKGSSRQVISRKLTDKGATEEVATKITDALCDAYEKQAAMETFTGKSLAPALWGGMSAAVLAGLVWGAIAHFGNMEVGWVAIGVGWLCGVAVVWAAGGKKGFPLQAVAVACSILGLVIGKYLTLYFALKAYLVEKGNTEAAEQLGLFSWKMLEIFQAGIVNMVNGFDLLWVALAVYTAWNIPKSTGIRAAQ